jgi:hypothetical protein
MDDTIYYAAHPETRKAILQKMREARYGERRPSAPERDFHMVQHMTKLQEAKGPNELLIIFCGEVHALHYYLSADPKDTAYIGTGIDARSAYFSVEAMGFVDILGGRNKLDDPKTLPKTLPFELAYALGDENKRWKKLSDIVKVEAPKDPSTLVISDIHTLRDTSNIAELPSAEFWKSRGFQKITFGIEPLRYGVNYPDSKAAFESVLKMMSNTAGRAEMIRALDRMVEELRAIPNQTERQRSDLAKAEAARKKYHEERIGFFEPRMEALLRKVAEYEKEIPISIQGIE